VTSLADLEGRVAALEADRADYRAVLAAVGALGQRVEGMDQRLGVVAVTTKANRDAINALGQKVAAHQGARAQTSQHSERT
jgi:hypothetical protein